MAAFSDGARHRDSLPRPRLFVEVHGCGGGKLDRGSRVGASAFGSIPLNGITFQRPNRFSALAARTWSFWAPGLVASAFLRPFADALISRCTVTFSRDAFHAMPLSRWGLSAKARRLPGEALGLARQCVAGHTRPRTWVTPQQDIPIRRASYGDAFRPSALQRPAIDRGEKIVLIPLALTEPEPRHAHCRVGERDLGSVSPAPSTLQAQAWASVARELRHPWTFQHEVTVAHAPFAQAPE
jgi:hypothetical protein